MKFQIGLGLCYSLFVKLTLYLGCLCLCFYCGTVALNKNVNDARSDRETRNMRYVFVILNQDEGYHIEKAHILKRNLLDDAYVNNLEIFVKISSDDFRESASWIYLLLADKLLKEKVHGLWYIFIEEFCTVNLKKLDSFLRSHKEKEELFYGKGLHDKSATIIHHFDSVNLESPFLYPDPRTAIIISRLLLERIASEWNPERTRVDFSIDASYEFSKAISNLGVKLTHIEEVCVREAERCFVWASAEGGDLMKERASVPLSRIHFAVKTCHKYSQERLGVLRDTWLPLVPNYALYSDVEDKEFGTISVNIPNVERGHCGKTIAIIHRAAEMDAMEWLVIADDDTLLSVSRLSTFLGAYDPSSPVAIGERYGYMVASGAGFEYPTGGAGMVLSKAAVVFLSEEGRCRCPANDTPDDMYLGSCLQRSRIPVVHSRRFHQARPDDYAPALLEDSSPISFHKFWMLDPRKAYQRWLVEPLGNEGDRDPEGLSPKPEPATTVRSVEEL